MTYSVRFLPSAANEFETIVKQLKSLSSKAATKFVEQFKSQADLLSSGILNYSLSRMPELAELGYRTALVGSYLFLYYIEGKEVVIAHFFSQRQDYANLV